MVATQYCVSSFVPSHAVPLARQPRYLFWLPLPQEAEQSDQDVHMLQFEDATETNKNLKTLNQTRTDLIVQVSKIIKKRFELSRFIFTS